MSTAIQFKGMNVLLLFSNICMPQGLHSGLMQNLAKNSLILTSVLESSIIEYT